MQKNPYISLLNLMEQVSRSSNSPDIQIGQILASPPDIKVRYKVIIFDQRGAVDFPLSPGRLWPHS